LSSVHQYSPAKENIWFFEVPPISTYCSRGRALYLVH
jgi:hypothetical protein